MIKKCSSLLVSIFLVVATYFVITDIQFTFDSAYAQSSQQNKIIEEEYINPSYNGQAPYSILYKIVIECEDTDNTCFDNILSRTGITGISAYFSSVSSNEVCIANIHDTLCKFVRANSIHYSSFLISGTSVFDSATISIRLHHNGTNIISGSLISPFIPRFTDPLEFSKRTISTDVDKDSIPDEIELNGITDQNGNLVFDLPGNGADPCRKTILLELDFMIRSPDHFHIPTQESINKAIEMFNNAPVPAETGQNCPYDGFPKESSGVNLIVNRDDIIPEIKAIDVFGEDTNGNPDDDFDTIKRNNFDPNLKPYFHHGLFAHHVINPDTRLPDPHIWGIGELEGNDFIISMGDSLQYPNVFFTTFFHPIPEAGTLVHELGHNLGLHHGGGDDTNCKPNYLSVMNYVFSSGLAKNEFGSPPFIDYSREKLPTLNEAHLNENDGISDGNLITIWREPRPNGPVLLGAGNMPLNWNNNFHGFLNLFPKIEDDVSVNINTLAPVSCDHSRNTANENLTGFNDWENIDYNFRDGINSNYAQSSGGEYVIEGPVEDLERSAEILESIYNADLEVTKQADLLDAIPGDMINYNVTIKNIGNDIAINVEIIDTLPDGKVEKRQIGDLNPGESRTEIFSYKVPFPIADGLELVNNVQVNGTNIFGNLDDFPANNNANASTLIHTPVFTVQKNSSLQEVNVGESIKHQITFANIGSGEAKNILINDTLPKGVYYHENADIGIGPKPNATIKNNDGTTTLVWNITNLEPHSSNKTIEYSVRPSLLMFEGEITNQVVLDFTDANNNDYSELQTSSETFVFSSSRPITNDPLSSNTWFQHDELWTPEILARIQATDQRYDGIDGSEPDGILTKQELESLSSLKPGQPKQLHIELLGTYFNLAIQRINADTLIHTPNKDTAHLNNVRDAINYSTDALSKPIRSNEKTYNLATTALRFVNMNMIGKSVETVNMNLIEKYVDKTPFILPFSSPLS